VRAVAIGPDGDISGTLTNGTAFTSSYPTGIQDPQSTVGPAEIRSPAKRLPSHVTLVDSPVRGSVPEATEGRLIIYVGATDADFEKVRPLLTVLGTPHHVGGPGAGAETKVVVNLTLGVTMAAPSGPTSSPAPTRPTSS
jgi:3-hydroxyisobutyrate dehydrogenase-like beta-hydroxyacid dehydrogenase